MVVNLIAVIHVVDLFIGIYLHLAGSTPKTLEIRTDNYFPVDAVYAQSNVYSLQTFRVNLGNYSSMTLDVFIQNSDVSTRLEIKLEHE